ncbi:MAG: class I SAM-dependent methyltransferase [Actinomycetota bacterium]
MADSSIQFAETSIDEVREYWNHRPCNIRHSPAPLGTREYFDQVEARKYFVEPHIPIFAQFDRWKDKKVLEIGCGIGTDTMNFARAGAQVTAVDLSSESLRLARQRAEIFELSDRIDFVEANAEQLSDFVKPDAYDLVYSFGVIHHTPHPDRVIDQIRGHFVQPGTTLKVMVYHKYSWKTISVVMTYGKGAFWNFDRVVADHSEAQTGCPVTFTYTKDDMSKFIGPGFKINEIKIEHIFPYKVSEYVNYKYEKVLHFKHMPNSLFRWLEQHFGWHLCATAEAT